MHHLEQISPEVIKKLRVASPAQLKNASLAAGCAAIRLTGVRDSTVADAIANLRSHENLPEQVRENLRLLSEALDSKYFELQEMAEDDPSLLQEAANFFCQARAVSSLYYASGEASYSSAVEAVYEAIMCVEDRAAVCKEILPALS